MIWEFRPEIAGLLGGLMAQTSDNNPVFTNEAASSYLTSDIQVLNSHGPRTNFLAGRG